jgi:hypothetical protein
MPYIGNPIYQSAFVVDTFSGNGSTVAFTMSVAPAGVTNVLVSVSGVLQDPSTYGVVGNTITFSAAPPSGTGNISCRYLGVPVTGVTTTAYRTQTEFTATAGQTTFTPPSYTVGFIDVYRNGVLLGSADYTATNGTTVVLTTGATSGDLVTVESFLVSSVLNAIPATAGSVGTANIADSAITTAKINNGSITAAKMATNGAWAPTGTVLQVIQGTITSAQLTTASATLVTTGITASITPQSTNSKILVIPNLTNLYAGGAGGGIGFSLYRGASQVYLHGYSQGLGYLGSFYSSGAILGSVSFPYLDSPATTSSTTYSIYWGTYNGSTAYINTQLSATINGTGSYITLMEIAG